VSVWSQVGQRGPDLSVWDSSLDYLRDQNLAKKLRDSTWRQYSVQDTDAYRCAE